METLNKSPRTSWREIQRHSALQKLEIHKGFLRFCALIGTEFPRRSAHVDLFSVSLKTVILNRKQELNAAKNFLA